MEALSNDFVLIDALEQPLRLSAEQIRRLAERRRGVGCDQVLVAEPPQSSSAAARYRIFNADGSEVEHCGNGIRCLARYLIDKGVVSGPRLQIETWQGLNELEVAADGSVVVDMGKPLVQPAQIPFRATEKATLYTLSLDAGDYPISAVSMGNPHAVLVVDEVDSAAVGELGTQIESHPRFPNRTNVGFMQIIQRNSIKLRVYERGVGETPACGTGACAATVAGCLRGLLDSPVKVELPGGVLVIDWSGEGSPVWMTGPARSVFHGEINI